MNDRDCHEKFDPNLKICKKTPQFCSKQTDIQVIFPIQEIVAFAKFHDYRTNIVDFLQ